MATTRTPRPNTGPLLAAVLPGADRRRSPAAYLFRVTYRHPPPGPPDGCVMTWEVTGGRQPYQVALERTAGGHRWHCSCPDAVYRGGRAAGHRCKHVRGLVGGLAALAPPAVTC